MYRHFSTAALLPFSTTSAVTKSSRDLVSAISTRERVTSSGNVSRLFADSYEDSARKKPLEWRTSPAFAKSSPTIHENLGRRMTSVAPEKPIIDRRRSPRGKRHTMVNKVKTSAGKPDLVCALRNYYDVSSHPKQPCMDVRVHNSKFNCYRPVARWKARGQPSLLK